MVSFAPFNNLPTQYRITVEGQQKWFAQWGLEALAVCWAFPGKPVQIDAPCLDCGESIQVVVRDGIVQNETPIGICGYTDIPRRQWEQNWPYTWSRIHLFRSEDHARKWSGFVSGTEEAILPVSDMMYIMSTPRHSSKLSGHYVSSAHEYAPLFFQRLEEVTQNSAFWRPKA
jgi:hypothetical protein